MKKASPTKRGYDEIDESLRRAFEEVVNEGVPDRFSDLLKRLKEGEEATRPGDGDEK